MLFLLDMWMFDPLNLIQILLIMNLDLYSPAQP